MAMRSHGAGALFLVMVMLGAGQVPLGTVGGGAGDARAPSPMADEPNWTDTLDDLSHVYVTEKVEVTGGEALPVVTP